MKKGAFYQEMHFGGNYRSVSFYVPDNYLRQLIKEYHKFNYSKLLPIQPTEPIIELVVSETSNLFLQSIIACFSQPFPPSEDLLEQKFCELIFSIMANPANQYLISYLNSIADQSKTSLFDVIESNYMYNLSLNDFARISNRSLATFKRDFKILFNTPPAKWLTDKRLEYARTLLVTSQKSVIDVCFDSGFENNSHFSRVFKEKFGLSPFHYRKEQIHSMSA